jgi:hypothetical protein
MMKRTMWHVMSVVLVAGSMAAACFYKQVQSVTVIKEIS